MSSLLISISYRQDCAPSIGCKTSSHSRGQVAPLPCITQLVTAVSGLIRFSYVTFPELTPSLIRALTLITMLALL